MRTYEDFLSAKRRTPEAAGLPCTPADVSADLFEFQRHLVAWAVGRGRAAIWADTGLGKTRMQVAWASIITGGTGGTGGQALILAPLAVAEQTVREAAAIGVHVEYVRDQAAADASAARIVITNYDRLHLLDPAKFDAVVLDESSVLKDFTTKTRDALIEAFRDTRFRLCCTATPAPNDVTELANHAEFLGVANRRHMLATYFINDGKSWRLKGHAGPAMWNWMTSWAVALRRPSDLGYADGGYELPRLDIRSHLLAVDVVPDGQLFATDLGGVGGRAAIRRQTLAARCDQVAALVAAEPDEPWLLWCGLNEEADTLTRAVPGAVNVHGAMPAEDKIAALLGFAAGDIPVLITKLSIAGWGMNWQHCARMAFVGLGDSYEQYYQGIRRCWRYGQTRPVDVHIVLSELESQIAVNVARKEQQVQDAHAALVAAMRATHQEAS